jgi:hypothetical protein
MASSAIAIWDGVRHPRVLLRHWVNRAPRSKPHADSDDAMAAPAHEASSPERLERIAAYARGGYFHVEYTAGMFVVPLDVPPE